MSSGQKRLQSNTRERLISNDFNRTQSFIAADRAAFNRRMFSDQYLFDVSAGLALEQVAITAPLSADIIGGLMVQPVIGTTSLTVTAGEMIAYYPDATPDADDDPSKTIFSSGVSAVGSLVIAANAGPSARIDIIECQPIELVEEQDNRDIFDPATGLFTPVLVDKVVSGRLQFRVRQGVAGAGFPANALGWLPLAVASVPAGSVSTDTITFWDVRPLVVDRTTPPFHAGSLLQERKRDLVYGNQWTSPGTHLYVSGHVDLQIGYYRAGGTIHKGTPTAAMGAGDLVYVDVYNAENQAPGFAVVANLPYYIYTCFPCGLPRWVRYTENNVGGYGRIPCPFRGIPVVSMIGPLYTGNSSFAIQMPASTGLGIVSATQNNTVVAAGHINAAANICGFVSDGHMCLVGDVLNGILLAPYAANINVDSYTLSGNLTHPNNARKVRLRIESNFTGVAGTTFTFSRDVYVKQFTGADIACRIHCGLVQGTFLAGGSFNDKFEVDVPIITSWPVTAPTNHNISVQYYPTASVTGRAGGSLLVVGWDMGP